MKLTRRLVLGAGGASLFVSSATAAPGAANRLVVVVLRGGMDGLAAAPPIGDPAYARVRGALALTPQQALRLDSTFALHPKLTTLKAAWDARELVLIHASGTPYGERSHFDAQNVLETGAARPHARDSGWLNVALGALPSSLTAGRKERGLAIADQAPLILRGPAATGSWSPSALPDANPDTIARLLALYRQSDPALADALQSAVAANAIAMDASADMKPGARRGARTLAPLAKAAAGFLKEPQGPLAVVLEMSGWDSHANQGVESGQLANSLGALDAGIATLKQELGAAWRHTAVLVVTEFGRTAAPNGNRGTDHGTGAAAFLVGGAVAGGRVIADWPGLAPQALRDGRDLRPTTDIRGVIKGVLADHLGVPANALTAAFPDSAGATPASSLLRT